MSESDFYVVLAVFDTDEAGIKASLRGIDMILEEGLNVKVLLFPDGEDPDSFAQSHSDTEYLEPAPGQGPSIPAPWTDWVFWQWTSHGHIPGHSGGIDWQGMVPHAAEHPLQRMARPG